MTRAKAEASEEVAWPPGEQPRTSSEAVPRGTFGEIELELDSDPMLPVDLVVDVDDVDDQEPTSRRRPLRAEALPPPPAEGEAPTRMHLDEGPEARTAALAAIRELYAGGEVAAALALASEVEVAAASGAPVHPSEEHGTAIVDVAHRASQLPSFLSPDRVPRLLVGAAEVAVLALDHRAGFLLAHVDGKQSMEEILDVCAMPEAEALAILERLGALGVIGW